MPCRGDQWQAMGYYCKEGRVFRRLQMQGKVQGIRGEIPEDERQGLRDLRGSVPVRLVKIYFSQIYSDQNTDFTDD